MKKLIIALCLMTAASAAKAADADTTWREAVRTGNVTSLFSVAVSCPGNVTVGTNLTAGGAITSATFTATTASIGTLTSAAKPVFTQAAVAAPTNTAARGFAITVNGTNYVVGLYPN